MPALLDRRITDLGIQLDGLGHFADVKRVGPHLINGHGDPPVSSLHTAVTSRVQIMYQSLDIVSNRGEANTLDREVRVRSKGLKVAVEKRQMARTLTIRIGSMDAGLKRFRAAYKAVEAGRPVVRREGVYFTTLEAVRNLLTPSRLALLRALRTQRPHSIYELA